MIKYVLFDLDGTLLGMDENQFVKIYFKSIYQKLFSQIGLSLEQTQLGMIKTLALLPKDERNNMSNMDKFFDIFSSIYPNINLNFVKENSDAYYLSSAFDECKQSTKRISEMIEVVNLLKTRGIKMAICTNPFFPASAIKKRISWAGLNIEDFEFVTVGEKSHYLKPNIKYYEEIYSKINEYAKEEILMVGNDVEEDMVSAQLGFNVYLIKNYLISRKGNESKILLQGYYEDFYKYVKENINASC